MPNETPTSALIDLTVLEANLGGRTHHRILALADHLGITPDAAVAVAVEALCIAKKFDVVDFGSGVYETVRR